MNTQTQTIHRAEVVGSMLRPPQLVEARAQMRAGRLDPAAYREIEDAAVDEALRIQSDAGVDVVTDGEMRRDIFFDFLIKGLTGLVMQPSSYSVRFHGHDADAAMEVQVPFSVVERITRLPCPAVAELDYASRHTDKQLKVTLPGPLMMLGMWGDASTRRLPRPAGPRRRRRRRGARLGARPGGGRLHVHPARPPRPQRAVAATQSVRDEWAARGIPVDELIALGVDFVQRFGDQDLPGVTKGMHLCKGNGTQAWIAEGGYERFARDVFGRAGGFDVFHLEYDDARSGGFEPLAPAARRQGRRARPGLDQVDGAGGPRRAARPHPRGGAIPPAGPPGDRAPVRLRLRRRDRGGPQAHPADADRQAAPGRRRGALGVGAAAQPPASVTIACMPPSISCSISDT